MVSKQIGFLALKYTYLICNAAVFVFGWILLITSAVILSHYGGYSKFADHKYANIFICILIVGVALVAVGFFGFYIGVKEMYHFLVLFSIFISIVSIAEIASGLIVFSYTENVNTVTTKALHRAVADYQNVTVAQEMVDWIQVSYKCCGSDGVQDFQKITSECAVAVPSCYDTGACEGNLYKRGCDKLFAGFVKENMLVLGGVAAGFSWLFNSVSIFLSCIINRLNEDRYELL